MPSANALPDPQSDWALFLDVDGTLIEIAETPDRIAPDRRLPEILTAISRKLGGAVALISGRPIATLDRLFAPLTLPAAGLHGLERRCSDGIVRQAPVSAAIREAVDAARAFAHDHPGILVEDKGATVALHFRQSPELEPLAVAFAEKLSRKTSGTTLQKGKMVVELRPTGSDKGTVIRAFMAESPFAARKPVFIGDDVTDEAGFIVVNSLDGYSIRVGDGQKTAARHRIAGVIPLLDWLHCWCVAS